MTRIYRGHLLHVSGSPALAQAREHLISEPDGVLVVDDTGTIVYSGSYAQLPAQYSSSVLVDHRPRFLLPGFVDTHVHYPQIFAVDAYGGGQLLEWLEHCIFPTEARLADPAFAQLVAAAFVRRRVRAGTTAALVFGSAFPAAQDILFTETLRAGLRIVSGRGIQTTGPPSAHALITSEKRAIELTAAEIERWHGADTGDPATSLAHVAVVPRFSLSVTPTTFAALGELYDAVRDRGVYFHSHINENHRPGTGEVDATRAAYGVDSYLDTYDGRFLPRSAVGGKSLLGRRSVLAHAVHCTDAELARMAETGTSIAHCPTSQLFLGSGTMPWRRTVRSGVTIALGSDIGAGDEWLISRVANDCFKVHMNEPGDASVALGPAELLFTATLAGARALDLEDRIGNLDVGKEADFLVVDPDAHPPLGDLLRYGVPVEDAETLTERTLFTLLTALREPAITEVYVRGRRVGAPTP